MPDADGLPTEYDTEVALAGTKRAVYYPPTPPVRMSSMSPLEYFDWVVERCVEWYNEGTDESRQAAERLFSVLLEKGQMAHLRSRVLLANVARSGDVEAFQAALQSVRPQ